MDHRAMAKNGIKAVEMTRRIRDAHYEQLKGKSPEERIAFYRQKAQAVEARVATEAKGSVSVSSEADRERGP